ncbi:MAG TPA: glycosyltransferase [Pseudolabrys sp.]|nr:glycosyltransferase [Pseudolabrys sp.]
MIERPHSDRDGPDPAERPQPPLFYIVDWLPPDFGAVGQYATVAARKLAQSGRDVELIGLTRQTPSRECHTFPESGGTLTIRKLKAGSYEKTRLLRRLWWSLTTNWRLLRAVLRDHKSRGADIVFTGAPPFMLYFAIALKYLRGARLTYRITDFYPEAIIAHLGRRPFALALLERATWFLRKRIDLFEVLGEDQRTLLLRGGIAAERIAVARDTSPVPVTGSETPATRPAALEGRMILLYSGNYGVAHEVETVAQGLAYHHGRGSDRFGLWLSGTGHNADLLELRLRQFGVPVARTPPVALEQLPSLLAAADAHLIALRDEFAGIVLPSKVYGCILSRRPIVYVGPTGSDVHLLCSRAQQAYFRVAPGDVAGFARALDALGRPPP